MGSIHYFVFLNFSVPKYKVVLNNYPLILQKINIDKNNLITEM